MTTICRILLGFYSYCAGFRSVGANDNTQNLNNALVKRLGKPDLGAVKWNSSLVQKLGECHIERLNDWRGYHGRFISNRTFELEIS